MAILINLSGLPNHSKVSMESTAKLKWQCRRGTKELDYLLEAYLNAFYHQASTEDKMFFNELLEMQDTVLIRYLLGNELPDSTGLRSLVKKIRDNNTI